MVGSAVRKRNSAEHFRKIRKRSLLCPDRVESQLIATTAVVDKPLSHLPIPRAAATCTWASTTQPKAARSTPRHLGMESSRPLPSAGFCGRYHKIGPDHPGRAARQEPRPPLHLLGNRSNGQEHRSPSDRARGPIWPSFRGHDECVFSGFHGDAADWSLKSVPRVKTHWRSLLVGATPTSFRTTPLSIQESLS